MKKTYKYKTKKNAFFFIIWGRKYVNSFLSCTAQCLLLNLEKIKITELKNSKIDIWTTKKDKKIISQNLIIKKLEKKITINYEFIEPFINLQKDFDNKYELLSAMQNIFICSHVKQFKFIWFFYPDFIFSENLIKNSLKKMKERKLDLILMPVPQINEEEVNKILNKKKLIDINMKKLISENIHDCVKYFEISKLENANFSFMCGIDKGNLLFKNFHMHPIVLKTKDNHGAFIKPIYPSLDEGMPDFFLNKKLFVPKNWNFGLAASLAKKNEHMHNLLNKDIPKSFDDSLIFSLSSFNEIPFILSKKKYVINKYTQKLKYKNLKIQKIFNKIIHAFKKKLYNKTSENQFQFNDNLLKSKYFLSNLFYLKSINNIIFNESKRSKFLNNDLIKFNQLIFYSLVNSNFQNSNSDKYSFKLSKEARKLTMDIFSKNTF